MEKTVEVFVGSNIGGFIIEREGKKFRKARRFLLNENVNSISMDKDRKIYAATLTEGAFSSSDMGRSWKPISKGLHVRKVWTVEPDPHRRNLLYAGTHYGHLFRSDDARMSCHEVTGLYRAPLRKEWGVDWAYGTTGLTIHTVKFDPQRKNRIYISSSGAGLYRSDDLGESWKLVRNGLMEDCPAFKSAPRPSKPSTEQDDLRKHLETVHTCTHKITSAKGGTLYQQNHCGIFMSENSGDRWMDGWM
jgi:hypothetical protein